MMEFAICDNKGFHITFGNGVTVSIQFGSGNYCANKMTFKYQPYAEVQKCVDAEVAIWDKDGKWITQKYDSDFTDVVVGYVTPDEVAKIIAWAQAYNGV